MVSGKTQHNNMLKKTLNQVFNMYMYLVKSQVQNFRKTSYNFPDF